MSKKNLVVSLLLSSVLGGLVAVAVMFTLRPEPAGNPQQTQEEQPVSFAADFKDTATFIVPEGLNFVNSAKKVTPAVVHIRAAFNRNNNRRQTEIPSWFREFFGDEYQAPRRNGPSSLASGSGVIINPQGYIVTNNHVVGGASKVTVTLNNNNSFDAEIVGTDPASDLALIKVTPNAPLPYVEFGSSERLQVGEWVLAVGNPFDLNSTVTAGIVSAKGRNIGIIGSRRDSLSVESFIQTDAVVNRGNSGGALVNLAGQLVGINTAIASPNGVYAGYSFAVPSTIVQKVVQDLKDFGKVQRALLGINIANVNSALAEELDIPVNQGVFVGRVNPGTGAEEAGMQEGDVIVAIDEVATPTSARLQEIIASHRPDDQVKVSYYRDGQLADVYVTLRAAYPAIAESGNEPATVMEVQGAAFENSQEPQGAKFKSIEAGSVWDDAGIDEGFVVTSIDNRYDIDNIDDLRKVLANNKGKRLLLLGVNAQGESDYHTLRW